MQDWHLEDGIISFILVFIIAAVLYDVLFLYFWNLFVFAVPQFHYDVSIPGFLFFYLET